MARIQNIPNAGNFLDGLIGDTSYQSGSVLTYFFGNSSTNFYGETIFQSGLTGTQVNAPFPNEARAAYNSAALATSLSFQRVFDQTQADLSLYGANNLSAPGIPPGSVLLGVHYFPGTWQVGGAADGYVGYGILNASTSLMTTNPAQAGDSAFRSNVTIHEIGHGLGLAHPQDSGHGSTTVLSGTALDNEMYTVMSYNEWTAEYPGFYPDGANYSYGHAAGYMALDIAALQHMYGANMSANTGHTTYKINDAGAGALDTDGSDGNVAIGRSLYSIWDAGGSDEIVYSGSEDSILNLNAATLNINPVTQDRDLLDVLNAVQNSGVTAGWIQSVRDRLFDAEHYAGGFFSQIIKSDGSAEAGGYSIANGAVIENASGGRGNDVLIGNAAKNRFEGNRGSDHIFGGAGRDVLEGGLSGDYLDGGADLDTALYINSNAAINVNLEADTADGGHARGDRLDNIENISGSQFGDRLTGDAKNNFLIGNGGRDFVFGGDGADKLSGNADRDWLYGQGGNDRLLGGESDDVLVGGIGADILDGGIGSDFAVYLGSASVEVRLYNGTALGGEAQGDTLLSIERLSGSNFNDVLSGNSVNNILLGNGGKDVLGGGRGDDLLNGGDDRDLLNGGSGDDVLIGGAEADRLIGGRGTDTADYTGSASVEVRLHNGVALGSHAQGDQLTDIENLTGSAFDDILSGDAGNNVLSGVSGDDIIAGGRGNDLLIGGLGEDVIHGGAGYDIAIFEGRRKDYGLARFGDKVTVTNKLTGETDEVYRVELLSFDDMDVVF